MTVTDQDNEDSTIEFKINVLNVNDAPNFVRFIYKTSERLIDSIDFNLAKQGKGYEATEYEPYEFKIEASDPDPDDELTFYVKIVDRTEAVGREMFSIDDVTGKPNTKEITVTPDKIAGREGELSVNVSVEDLLKAKAWVIIMIPVKNTNDPPEEPIIDVEIVDADRKTRKIENLSATFSIYYSTDIMYMDPDGENETDLTYTWDFGDESDLETGMVVDHKFPKEGTYTVNLTVTDSEGLSTTVSKDVEIIKPAGSDGGGDSDDDAAGIAGLGKTGEIDNIFLVFLVVIIVIILVVVFMMMAKKKREAEEEEEEQARMQQMQQAQAQMMAAQMAAYYQDQNMMAQMQAFQQQQYQQMQQQQYPDQYQYQQMEQQYPDQYQQQIPYGYDTQSQQPVQSEPIATAAVAAGYGYGTEQQMMAPEGAGLEAGLPASGISSQPQLPPAPEEDVQPEFPESPFAGAETQTLEEELGADAEVAEIPIEPGEVEPETEMAPEPEAGADAETETEAKEETKDKKEPEPAGKKCQHCGAGVKDGWFLCPECKKPLI